MKDAALVGERHYVYLKPVERYQAYLTKEKIRVIYWVGQKVCLGNIFWESLNKFLAPMLSPENFLRLSSLRKPD